MKVFSHRQSGAALITGLMILLIITLAVVVAVRSNVLEERMAGGLRNQSLAETAVDSALRDGEQWIWNWVVSTGGAILRPGETAFVVNPESQAPFTGDTRSRDFRRTQGWVTGSEAYSRAYQDNAIASNTYGELSRVPRFLIEPLGPFDRGSAGSDVDPVSHEGSVGAAGELVYYRITARGSGGTPGVVRVAESTFTTTR